MEEINVKFTLLGQLMWYSPGHQKHHQLQIGGDRTVGEVLELELHVPTAEIGFVKLNGFLGSVDERLSDGDQVDVMPVVAGG